MFSYCNKIDDLTAKVIMFLSIVILFPGSQISSCGHNCCGVIVESSEYPSLQCIVESVSLHTGRVSSVNLQ